MKKKRMIVAGILMIGVLLGMSGCAGKETMICTATNNNVTVKMTYEAQNDKITKITQASRIDTKDLTEEQVSEVKARIKEAEAQYEEIGGVTYATEEKSGEILESIVIKGDKETIQAVVKAGLLPVDSAETTELSLDATRTAMEKAGWTIK